MDMSTHTHTSIVTLLERMSTTVIFLVVNMTVLSLVVSMSTTIKLLVGSATV